MLEQEPDRNHFALIVDPDPARSAAISDLLECAGVGWEKHRSIGADPDKGLDHTPDTVFVSQEALEAHLQAGGGDLRRTYATGSVLVGVFRSPGVNSPTLFGEGLDVTVYEPLALADIERVIAFADAVQNETQEQARARLRKMTALHELAITSARQTGTTGWLERLIEAGRRILGPDALAMWVLDRESRMFHCLGSSGLPAEYVRHAEQVSPSFVDVYDHLNKQPTTHWLTPEDTDENFRLAAPGKAQEVGIKRVAWLPARDVNRLYGHLSFYYMSTEAFETHDLVLTDAFTAIVVAVLRTHSLQSEIHRSNRLYREQVEMSPDGVLVCRPDGTVERANLSIESIAGRERFEILGKPVFDLFLESEHVPWDQWKALDPNDLVEYPGLWLSRPDGERRRVSCHARRVQLPEENAVGGTEDRIQLVLRDVTVQARRIVELELFHDLTRLISEHGSIDEAFELVVSRLYEYLNYRLVAIGEVVDSFLLTPRAYRTHGDGISLPEYFDTTMGICGRAIRENRSILQRDISNSEEYYSIDDDVVSELVSVIRVDGAPVGIIDIQTHVSQPLDEGDLQLADSIAAHLGLLIEQVTAQERLETQAMTDPLTGVANRRAFMNKIHSLINDVDAAPAALFLVELDHFKQVNDQFGHLFGDEMLIQVAARLQSVLRDDDLLARYGGDEIAIVFHDLDMAGAVEIAERLRRVISDEPFVHNGSSISLTVSIGIALYPHHGTTTDELIGEADRAMYAAKLEGRNSVHADFLTSATSD